MNSSFVNQFHHPSSQNNTFNYSNNLQVTTTSNKNLNNISAVNLADQSFLLSEDGQNDVLQHGQINIYNLLKLLDHPTGGVKKRSAAYLANLARTNSSSTNGNTASNLSSNGNTSSVRAA